MVSFGDESTAQLSALETSKVSPSSKFETDSNLSHYITPETSTPAPTNSIDLQYALKQIIWLSSKLGLPSAAIVGISKKAAQILCSGGAVVDAPSHPAEAQMVISRTRKRPHLVLPKRKSGGMACDDCPSTNLRKYVLVLQQQSTRNLMRLLHHVEQKKKMPNITELPTADVPKGRALKVELQPKENLRFLLRRELNCIHPHQNSCPALQYMQVGWMYTYLPL